MLPRKLSMREMRKKRKSLYIHELFIAIGGWRGSEKNGEERKKIQIEKKLFDNIAHTLSIQETYYIDSSSHPFPSHHFNVSLNGADKNLMEFVTFSIAFIE